MDAIWAARLGLEGEACGLLLQHARQFNRFRYGGWDSNDSNVGPDGLAAAPFLDAGGLSAFALQEILLQSHGGIIRVAPALDPSWSGVFRLRAEGGFLVAADVQEGVIRLVEVASLWGRECVLANPWPEGCAVTAAGRHMLRTDDPLVRFPTQAGVVYVLESTERPASSWSVGPLTMARNGSPGLPGRDAVDR